MPGSKPYTSNASSGGVVPACIRLFVDEERWRRFGGAGYSRPIQRHSGSEYGNMRDVALTCSVRMTGGFRPFVSTRFSHCQFALIATVKPDSTMLHAYSSDAEGPFLSISPVIVVHRVMLSCACFGGIMDIVPSYASPGKDSFSLPNIVQCMPNPG